MRNIEEFHSTFRASRSNRYKITGNTPTLAGNGSIDFDLYAKAVSFPGTQIGMIPVSYQGRIIKFSGERQFGEWSIQVYDSSVNHIRQLFETWMQTMDSAKEHVINYNVPANEWSVSYDDTTSTATAAGSQWRKKMTLKNVWPVDISPIDLSYESADSFSEFTLTLTYDYHIMTTTG